MPGADRAGRYLGALLQIPDRAPCWAGGRGQGEKPQEYSLVFQGFSTQASAASTVRRDAEDFVAVLLGPVTELLIHLGGDPSPLALLLIAHLPGVNTAFRA